MAAGERESVFFRDGVCGLPERLRMLSRWPYTLAHTDGTKWTLDLKTDHLKPGGKRGGTIGEEQKRQKPGAGGFTQSTLCTSIEFLKQ